jgi:cell division protein FtsX
MRKTGFIQEIKKILLLEACTDEILGLITIALLISFTIKCRVFARKQQNETRRL